MISPSKLLKENRWTQVVVLLLLLLLLGLAGVPGYLTGKWQWKQPAPVTNIQKLIQIHQTGLSLPGWQTAEQGQQQVGEQKWSLQVIKKADSQTQALLLLFPQRSPKDKPQAEWSQISGWGRLRWGKWDIAQERSAEFTVKPARELGNQAETRVEARFFRASTQQNTFAVLQWYAFPNGGNPSSLHWFLGDQLAQWRQHRTPWVSVSILIPIEPLGKVETVWPLAQSLGQTVQATLMAGPLENS
ncbi:MAG: cyanoexosortase B system-associated protein [Goleter apudmare HA4340-LM2]|jgi:cyanoexosortase B-associated protein|nr:cyanoexosortase B system-associated protein [Goleter apudmare HA4340-LM2]